MRKITAFWPARMVILLGEFDHEYHVPKAAERQENDGPLTVIWRRERFDGTGEKKKGPIRTAFGGGH